MEDRFLDCDSILSHLRQSQKQLKLKRRWLMGLPLTKYQQRKLFKYCLSARSVPESMLREDDVFYETVKMYVEERFGACEADRGDHMILETGEQLEINSVKRILLSRLDSLTNKGLYLVAVLLTKECVNFEKTRKKMKKVIKESISELLLVHNHEHEKLEVCKRLFELLSDPKNFREGCSTSLIPSIHSHYFAAVNILDRLEDLSTETLLAMLRKLRGVPACISFSKRKRYGWKRHDLIHRIRKTGKKILSEHHEENELPAPLAKALAVACLSRKLNAGWSNASVPDFNQFSAEIKALQNQIVKAIWSLKTKVRFSKLNTLKLLLDRKTDVSSRCLRSALKRLLTQYLFECSELDTVPKAISEALSIINKNSQTVHRECNPSDEIEKEVECLLGLSADVKQIVWDNLPFQDIDEDFANAYVEELEESDNDFDHAAIAVDNVDREVGDSQISNSSSMDWEYQEESVCEFIPVNFQAPISTPEKNRSPSLFHESRKLNGMVNVDINHFEAKSIEESPTLRGNSDISQHLTSNKQSNHSSIWRRESEQNIVMDLGNQLDLLSSNILYNRRKIVHNSKSTYNNRYLGIQEICDDTSMVAYNLIGCIMEGMAEDEGIDLDMGHYSYLRGDYSTKKSQEETKIAFEGNLAGSVILKVAEDLLPSLPKSAITKLKELIES